MAQNKLSLRTLIFFLSISLFAIITINAIFSYLSVNQISQQVQEITETQIPLLKKINQLDHLHTKEFNIVEKFILYRLTNESSLTQQQQKNFENISKEMHAHLDEMLHFFHRISSNNDNYTNYLSLYKSLHLIKEQQQVFTNEINDLFTEEQTTEQIQVTIDNQKLRSNSMLNDIQKLVENLPLTRQKHEQHLQNKTMFFSVLAIIIIIVLTYITLSISTRKLHQISDSLSATFQSITRASDELYNLSVQISSGAHEQASSVEKVANTLEQMASMTQQNSKSTIEIDEMSTRTKELAALGNDTVNRLQGAMHNILSSSNRTEEIVNTIQEIAFQTNILSLNASVEAAKAGEAGKGFVVVANEIRDLAQRTSQGAKNIIFLIDQSKRYVEEGVTSVTDVQKTFDNIFHRIQKLADTTKAIAEALSDQVGGMEQVKNSVGEIDNIVQLNVANTQEGASAAEKLHAQSYELEQAIQDLRTIVHGNTI
ncbi:methyl-accepting chemotaxis protein [Candidatus Uabimicrobium sp. HlEnr_7]|uniref:methyl-accepting chemotaxis protein n=1 Tax=Candidatus Uabimicrobium helgolandensis TaxID=3095367 RepID=UPI0035574D6D